MLNVVLPIFIEVSPLFYGVDMPIGGKEIGANQMVVLSTDIALKVGFCKLYGFVVNTLTEGFLEVCICSKKFATTAVIIFNFSFRLFYSLFIEIFFYGIHNIVSLKFDMPISDYLPKAFG